MMLTETLVSSSCVAHVDADVLGRCDDLTSCEWGYCSRCRYVSHFPLLLMSRRRATSQS